MAHSQNKLVRMLIDSNALQSDMFRDYLARSANNFAVLNDYLSMESYKGNTLVSIERSMQVLCLYPRQVIVLKPTGKICALYGRVAGFQRRMIDDRQSKDFPIYCKDLRAGLSGDKRFQAAITKNGQVADAQMALILADAPMMTHAIKELKSYFTKDEIDIIRLDKPFTGPLIYKTLEFITSLFFMTAARHPFPSSRIINKPELINTFLFRYAVVTFVWSLEWIRQGGADNVRADRLRNDLIDVIFATYATYFDGLLSNDEMAQRIYRKSNLILRNIGAP